MSRQKLQPAGFYPYMLRLALPVAVQNLLMAAFQLIDSAMVSKLGDAAMAGVSMAGRWSFILQITLFGINSGASILYSQYKGIEDEAGIRRVYGLALLNTMVLVALFGLAMALFPHELVRVFAGANNPDAVEQGAAFMQIIALNCLVMGVNYSTSIMLRSTEEVRLPLYTSLLAVMINTSLNWVLIYGNLGMPRLGVRGAAVSTLISSFVQMVLMQTLLRRKKHPVFHTWKGLFAIDRELINKFYPVAMPVIFNELFWALGSSVYMFVYGRVSGETCVAAYSLYSSTDQLLFSFIIGVASACGVMVGKAVGSGDNETAWSYSKRFIYFGVLFAIGLSALEIILRVPLINLISPENPATGALAKQILLIGAFALPWRMLSMLLIVAIFRSGGNPMMGAIIDVGGVWLVGAPIVVLCGFAFHLPFLWLFALMYAEEVVKNVVGLVLFFQKRWMRRLTDTAACEPVVTVLEPEL